jgi:hypothetical protein
VPVSGRQLGSQRCFRAARQPDGNGVGWHDDRDARPFVEDQILPQNGGPGERGKTGLMLMNTLKKPAGTSAGAYQPGSCWLRKCSSLGSPSCSGTKKAVDGGTSRRRALPFDVPQPKPG